MSPAATPAPAFICAPRPRDETMTRSARGAASVAVASALPPSTTITSAPRARSGCSAARLAANPDRIGTLADAVDAVREAGAGRGIPVLVGGQITAQPGILEACGADALVTSIAAALAFAEAHRPAETGEPGSD